MQADFPYHALANAVLALHFLVVAFVAGGLALIVAGNLLHWRWVNNIWFRAAHLAAIAVVVLQSWAGADCPLTLVEAWLRERAGSAFYQESFIEHWLARLLYYDAPGWAFIAAYTGFGLLVAAVWWRFPPRRIKSGREAAA